MMKVVGAVTVETVVGVATLPVVSAPHYAYHCVLWYMGRHIVCCRAKGQHLPPGLHIPHTEHPVHGRTSCLRLQYSTT